jgi:uncharacterized membrane protein
MAGSFAVADRNKQIHLRHLLFSALLLMFLFVLWHDERFVFVHSDEKWAYYSPVRWLVLPHVLGGMIALLIGPFQFSSRFRQRHPRLHRVMGRIYLASVAVAAIVALYVSAIHQKEMQDKEWVFALDIAWLVTGMMAFVAILNRNVEAHRQWITRNYAFTTVFVTVRVLNALPIPDAYGLGPGWILLLATLLVTEIGLSWRSVLTNRRLHPPRPDKQ